MHTLTVLTSMRVIYKIMVLMEKMDKIDHSETFP